MTVSGQSPALRNEMDEHMKRLLSCSTCHKVFKRTEHCLRHERTHNRERPYACRFCDRSYGRRDLLVRHEKSLHSEAWSQAQHKFLSSGIAAKRSPRGRLPSNSQMAGCESEPRHPAARPVQKISRKPESSMVSGADQATNDTAAGDSQLFEGSHSEQTMELVNGRHYDLNYPLTPGFLETRDTLPDLGCLQQSGSPARSQNITDGIIFEQPASTTYDSQMEDDLMDLNHDALIGPDSVTDPTIAEVYSFSMPNLNTGFEDIDFFSSDLSFMDYFSVVKSPCNNPEYSNYTAPQLGVNSIASESQRLPRACSSGSRRDYVSNNEVSGLASPASPPAHLPRLSSGKQQEVSLLILDENARVSLLADVRERIGIPEQKHEFGIPKSQDLQRYINQFLNSFNIHLPIFHLPSFDTKKVPSPLILIMCSIGALYHLERKTAAHLRELANDTLNKTFFTRLNRASGSPRPLWEVQCKLLVTLWGVFGSNAAAVSLSIEEIGVFHREYSLRRPSLSPKASGQDCSSWSEWIDRESSKRLLYGIFIMSSLLTNIYRISPGFSITHDLEIEMPDDDWSWSARTEEQWRDAMTTRSSVTQMTASQALARLMFGSVPETDTNNSWPAFGIIVLLHAVNIYMWHVGQSTPSSTIILIDPALEEEMKVRGMAQLESVLARCHRILTGNRSSESGHTWDAVEGPLAFNGLSVLRSCYVRAFTSTDTFDRSMLFSESDVDIECALKHYVKSPQVRTPFLTKSVRQSLWLLSLAFRAGHLKLMKTAAFTWSVEHAVAGWDCALFSTKWIHLVIMEQSNTTPNQEEQENIATIRELLRLADKLPSENGLLAAELARLWAGFLDDVWTLEVTWRMGQMLRRLGNAYEEEWRLQCLISQAREAAG